MDDYSWAGWAAVKMTSDTVARTQITNSNKRLSLFLIKLARGVPSIIILILGTGRRRRGSPAMEQPFRYFDP